MKKFRYIKSVFLVLTCAIVLTTSNVCIKEVVAVPTETATQSTQQTSVGTNPIDIINSPGNYLNKTVTINGKFSQFSTLGLDYKTALRQSDKYITFLIKRPDTTYDIPLSEMKLFLKRKEKKKHIDLKSDDEIKFTGKVFSDALGDAWIDVDDITITKKAPEKNGVK
ncbi:MAG: hypothetical protein MJ231_04745 [bacterium]|nr:hypothetical protein [bacterium]